MKTIFQSIVTAGSLLLVYALLEVYFEYQIEPPPSASSLSSISPPPSPSPLELNTRCQGLTKWIVVISDSRVLTSAMRTVLNSTTDWCLLVLGIIHTRLNLKPGLNTTNLIYMSRKQIASLPYKLVNKTSLHSFNTRNIGYLYAIHRGAKVILDMKENSIPHAIYQEQLYNDQQPHKIPELSKDDAIGKQIFYIANLIMSFIFPHFR